jgi:hypothetical protein
MKEGLPDEGSRATLIVIRTFRPCAAQTCAANIENTGAKFSFAVPHVLCAIVKSDGCRPQLENHTHHHYDNSADSAVVPRHTFAEVLGHIRLLSDHTFAREIFPHDGNGARCAPGLHLKVPTSTSEQCSNETALRSHFHLSVRDARVARYQACDWDGRLSITQVQNSRDVAAQTKTFMNVWQQQTCSLELTQRAARWALVGKEVVLQTTSLVPCWQELCCFLLQQLLLPLSQVPKC